MIKVELPDTRYDIFYIADNKFILFSNSNFEAIIDISTLVGYNERGEFKLWVNPEEAAKVLRKWLFDRELNVVLK